jgi:hypothetical protein
MNDGRLAVERCLLSDSMSEVDSAEVVPSARVERRDQSTSRDMPARRREKNFAKRRVLDTGFVDELVSVISVKVVMAAAATTASQGVVARWRRFVADALGRHCVAFILGTNGQLLRPIDNRQTRKTYRQLGGTSSFLTTF